MCTIGLTDTTDQDTSRNVEWERKAYRFGSCDQIKASAGISVAEDEEGLLTWVEEKVKVCRKLNIAVPEHFLNQPLEFPILMTDNSGALRDEKWIYYEPNEVLAWLQRVSQRFDVETTGRRPGESYPAGSIADITRELVKTLKDLKKVMKKREEIMKYMKNVGMQSPTLKLSLIHI